uniref:Osteoclast stimulating factor 1 n=1 Tax=Bos indicus x Bos taurus TaxID=30522 RepID=A0A4W2FR57_BOBOX
TFLHSSLKSQINNFCALPSQLLRDTEGAICSSVARSLVAKGVSSYSPLVGGVHLKSHLSNSLHVVTPADSVTAVNTPFLEAVAEQAESIDNPLHEAAKRGNLSWLRECLDNRVGVNGLDKAGSTALYWACHGGHRDIVEMLFTQPNIELNQQNKLGDTALHAAAWKGYADIVQLLLEKGARTDLRNNEKKLALDMATNAACASLLKKKQGTDAVRSLSNAEDYLDDEDSD